MTSIRREDQKLTKKESWERFGHRMSNNVRENQKLFYGTLRQLRQKKEYNVENIKGTRDG